MPGVQLDQKVSADLAEQLDRVPPEDRVVQGLLVLVSAARDLVSAAAHRVLVLVSVVAQDVRVPVVVAVAESAAEHPVPLERAVHGDPLRPASRSVRNAKSTNRDKRRA